MTQPPSAITAEQRAFAENALHNLPFARLIGMRLVDLKPDEAVISIEMRDDLRQPSGVLHGWSDGDIDRHGDGFRGTNTSRVEEKTATIDLTVHYLRPHLAGTFTCTAKVVRAGKRIFTVSADVHNEEGKLIATGLSTYTRVEKV